MCSVNYYAESHWLKMFYLYEPYLSQMNLTINEIKQSFTSCLVVLHGRSLCALGTFSEQICFCISWLLLKVFLSGTKHLCLSQVIGKEQICTGINLPSSSLTNNSTVIFSVSSGLQLLLSYLFCTPVASRSKAIPPWLSTFLVFFLKSLSVPKSSVYISFFKNSLIFTPYNVPVGMI